MATTYHGAGTQSPTALSKPIERVFEDAQHTGEIQLCGRKLREYPKIASKYDLVDTISTGRFVIVSLSTSSTMNHHHSFSSRI